jgi:hypothetical protein
MDKEKLFELLNTLDSATLAEWKRQKEKLESDKLDAIREKMDKVLTHLTESLQKIGINEITIKICKDTKPTFDLHVRKHGSGGGHKGNGYDPAKIKVALDSGDKTQIKACGSFNLAQYMIETFGDENVRAKLEELCPWMAENGGGSIKGSVRGARDRMGLPTTLEK